MTIKHALDHIDLWRQNVGYMLPLIVIPMITISFYTAQRYLCRRLTEKTICLLRKNLYEKLLSRQVDTQTSVVQLAGEDACYASKCWSVVYLAILPIFIVMTFFLLWGLLGWASLFGISILCTGICCFQILSGHYAEFHKKSQELCTPLIDKLYKLLPNLFAVQVRNLEDIVFKDIMKTRGKQEAHAIMPKAKFRALINFIQCAFVLLAPFASIFAYLVLETNPSIVNIFTSLNLMFILEYHFLHLQKAIVDYREAQVCFKRLLKVLSNSKEEMSVDQSISKNIHEGGLHLIIGPNPSDNTDFFHRLAGSFAKENTSLRCGILTKATWLFQSTVGKNVTLFSKVGEKKLSEILNACALKSPSTEVGRDGNRLSYGQRKRVALARMLCHTPDIYFMDEPMQGLNPQLRNELTEKILLDRLDDKTRVVVGDCKRLLNHANKIFLIENNDVFEFDSKDHLQQHDSPFMKEWLGQNESDAYPLKDEGDSDTLASTASRVTIEKNQVSPKLFHSIALYVKYLYQGSIWKFFRYLPFSGLFLVLSNLWISDFESLSSSLSLTKFLSVYVLLISGSVFFSYVSCREIFMRAVASSTRQFKRFLLSLLSFSHSEHRGKDTEQALNTIVHDTARLNDDLPQYFFHGMDLFWFISFSFFTLFFNVPHLLLIFPILLLTYWRIFSRGSKKTMKYAFSQAASRGRILDWFHETKKGLTTICSLKQEKRFAERLEKFQNHYLKTALGKAKHLSMTWLRLEFTGVGMLGAICLFFWIFPTKLPLGVLSLIFSYGFSMIQDISVLGFQFSEFQTESAALHRLQPIKEVYSVMSPGIIQRIRAELCLKELSFRYGKHDTYLLDQLSLRCVPGQVTGIAGRSGVGKSTLIHLLTRHLVPQQGDIQWGGVSIYNMNLQAYRAQIGVSLQAADLIGGSVREWIDPRYSHSSKEITNVFDLLELDLSLEDQVLCLDEKQKEWLIVGEILLRKPSLVIFDEPGMTFGMYDCKRFVKILNTQLPDSIIFFTTHNLHLMSFCDRVLQLKDKQLNLVGRSRQPQPFSGEHSPCFLECI